MYCRNYNTGSVLWKKQWDKIHDPATVLGLFEEDEGGELVENLETQFLSEPIGEYNALTFEQSTEYILCFTPAGKIFALKKDCKLDFINNTDVKVPAGSLVGFEYNGSKYIARYQKNKNEEWYFRGYFKEGVEGGSPMFSMLTREQLDAMVSKEQSVNIQTASMTSLGFAMVMPLESAKLAAWLEALTLRGLGVAKTLSDLVKGNIIYLAGYAVWQLFATGSYLEYGVGTVVLELPLPPVSIASEWKLKDGIPASLPITAPVTIEHKIPNDKGDCSVYVIFKIGINSSIIQIAKYGITCQTNNGVQCDTRPNSQCQVFNTSPNPIYENHVFKYSWCWIPFVQNVSEFAARLVERSLTGAYILSNRGLLPPVHKLPCFKKIDDWPDEEALEERIQRVSDELSELIKKYGTK